ncbi:MULTISPECIES: hypothetical protein [unclassified Acinetobacter]|uniref:hypothetical protein n=1 Tax=unclassified Acinetobacter TaxID=196816 RepID=UPI002934645A|nr:MULTISPECIES: hypothetical protein [unclassified Acinetobacter]WOE32587.1 hypothetical protein QSG84_05195 [Acinetobacter sp. SAAs470]WOE38062.1 hypothetical protein QSG86_14250 [Acinetobacter sp. SAAs474]
MQKTIAGTIFYSLLFAMGGSPTLAMIIIQLQHVNPAYLYQAFIGLTVMIACILVPLILLQNAYLFFKRHNETFEIKVKKLYYFYLALNVGCLLFWLLYQLF